MKHNNKKSICISSIYVFTNIFISASFLNLNICKFLVIIKICVKISRWIDLNRIIYLYMYYFLNI